MSIRTRSALASAKPGRACCAASTGTPLTLKLDVPNSPRDPFYEAHGLGAHDRPRRSWASTTPASSWARYRLGADRSRSAHAPAARRCRRTAPAMRRSQRPAVRAGAATNGGLGVPGGRADCGASTRFCTLHLEPLHDARRKFAAALHLVEVAQPRHALSQDRRQDVRRRDRVLDREIDADAADRRHRMRRVADAQQARAAPSASAGRRVTVSSFTSSKLLIALDAVAREARDACAAARGSRTGLRPSSPRTPPLGMTQRALPVIAAIEHDEEIAADEARHRLAADRPARSGRRSHNTSNGAPKSRTFSLALSRTVEWRPSAPITSSRGSRRRRPASCTRTPDDAPALGEQLGDLGLHHQTERSEASRLAAEEIEEVPLRHQRDELAARRQVREVADVEALLADLDGDLAHLVVRAGEELVEQAQLGDQLAASRDGSCRRGNRAGSPCASPARSRRRRRARADSPHIIPAGPPPAITQSSKVSARVTSPLRESGAHTIAHRQRKGELTMRPNRLREIWKTRQGGVQFLAVACRACLAPRSRPIRAGTASPSTCSTARSTIEAMCAMLTAISTTDTVPLVRVPGTSPAT